MQKRILNVSLISFILLLSFATIALGCPAPEVVSITPNSGLNNQTVDIVITGAKFHKTAYVKLTKEGQADIIATNLNITKTEITCTLDLTGKAPGSWDLVVGNVGTISKKEKPAATTETFTIKGAIKVTPPAEVVKPEPQPVVEAKPEEKPAPFDPNQGLETIYFDFDKSNIRQDQLDNLKSNVKILKENADLKIVLAGHADERGTEEYNIKLSTRRAETIKKYLVEQGIAADRITVYAYGEKYPMVTGKGESAWSFNRRVDISLWKKVPSQQKALEKPEL